jgi:membrane dipeptidase
VAYTHTLPAAHKAHPRNKTDEQLRLLAEHDGFVGLTFFPAFLRNGPNATIDDYLEAAEHVIDVVGEERVGIGTDFTEDQPPAFFDYITRDKGEGRRLVEFGPVVLPQGLQRIADLRALPEAMAGRGWSEQRVRRVLGENWLGFLREVWGADELRAGVSPAGARADR